MLVRVTKFFRDKDTFEPYEVNDEIELSEERIQEIIDKLGKGYIKVID